MEQWVLPAVLAGVTLLFVAWAVLDGRRRARWLRRRVRDSFGAVPVDTGPGLATPRWYECAPGRGVPWTNRHGRTSAWTRCSRA